MIRVVIVDDEPLVLNLLKKRLKDRGDIDIIGEFTDSEEALEKIPGLEPDIAFLDVEMPEMDGIELASKLQRRNIDMDIVFVTAYEQYAVEAFKLNALHYILKPVDDTGVTEVLRRMSKKSKPQGNERYKNSRIQLFGDVVILNQSGEKVNWVTAKAKELFVLLLIHQKKGVNKWHIIEHLWPDSDSEKAHQNLYTTVFRLKRSLKEAGMEVDIENNDGHYRIILRNTNCDWCQFQSFVVRKPEFNDKTVKEYEKIISLYTADLLESCGWIWSFEYQENCRIQYKGLVESLVQYYKKINDCVAADRLHKSLERILRED